MNPPTIHPYYRQKARAWMRRAGARPQDAGDLARWAQNAALVGDPGRGIIVAQDGTLVAETFRCYGLIPTDYADLDAMARIIGTPKSFIANQADMAVHELARAIGQPCARATYSDLCRGARGPEVPDAR